MLASTKREHRGCHFTVVVSKNSDAKLFRSDNVDIDLEKDNAISNSGVRELTREQGSPEWFVLRRFVITSNIAVKAL